MPKFLTLNSALATFGSLVILSGCGIDTSAQTTTSKSDIAPSNTGQAVVGVTPIHANLRHIIQSAEVSTDTDNLRAALNQLDHLGVNAMDSSVDVAALWSKNIMDRGEDLQLDPPMRGRIQGSAYRLHTLPPGESDVLKYMYYAAEDVEMSLSTPSGLQLNWEISESDDKSEPLCWGRIDDAGMTCTFTPLWTSRYSVTISNLSEQDTTYLFVTN